MAISIDIAGLPQKVIAQVEAELPSRAARVSDALMNAKNEVLSKPGTGRMYGSHQASAPGQPPAYWTGRLMGSFVPLRDDPHLPGIMTSSHYAGYLEDGTSKMAARPFRQPIIDAAQGEIESIFQEPWHIKF